MRVVSSEVKVGGSDDLPVTKEFRGIPVEGREDIAEELVDRGESLEDDDDRLEESDSGPKDGDDIPDEADQSSLSGDAILEDGAEGDENRNDDLDADNDERPGNEFLKNEDSRPVKGNKILVDEDKRPVDGDHILDEDEERTDDVDEILECEDGGSDQGGDIHEDNESLEDEDVIVDDDDDDDERPYDGERIVRDGSERPENKNGILDDNQRSENGNKIPYDNYGELEDADERHEDMDEILKVEYLGSDDENGIQKDEDYVSDDGIDILKVEAEKLRDEEERSEYEDEEEISSKYTRIETETETFTIVEIDDVAKENSTDEQSSEMKEEADTVAKRVSRGASGYEKLLQCDNCKKIYRSSNLARHRRSCLQLPRGRSQSDSKDESDDAVESMESETVEKAADKTNLSSKTETAESEKSVDDLIYLGTKKPNKTKEPPFKVKLFGRKSKQKHSKKMCTEKKALTKLKQAFSDAKPKGGNDTKQVKNDSEVYNLVGFNAGNMEPKVQKPRTKVCSFCLKTFAREKQLRDHIRTHTGEKPFQCALCGSTFATEKTLDQHMKVHTGEKPYKCNVCGHASSQLGNLQRHMRSHTNERPFLCTQCGFAFKEKNHLDGHVRIHTGERPYECKECHRRFSVSSSLHCHMRTHTGVKPISCAYCDKKFARRTSLNEHIGKHLGVRIECQQCGAVFSHKRSLVSHMQTHETPKYACIQCGKTFSRKRNLTRHLEMHERRKHKKTLMSDGMISNSAEISSNLNPQQNEHREARNFPPEHIPPPEHTPPFSLPSTNISQTINSLYGMSRYQNTYRQAHPDAKEKYDSEIQDNGHRGSLLAELEHDIRGCNDVHKKSAFQGLVGPADTSKDVNKVGQANPSESSEINYGQKVAFSNRKQDDSIAFKDFSETVVNMVKTELERKTAMIHDQNKEAGKFDDQRECEDDMYTDEMETMENSSDNSLVVDGTKHEDKEKSEKLIIVKQETMHEDEEYGQIKEVTRKKIFVKDDIEDKGQFVKDDIEDKGQFVKDDIEDKGHDFGYAEKLEEYKNDGFKEAETRKLPANQAGSGIEPISNVVVKIENEDENSSDNTVIMEPNALVEELKQFQEKQKKFACLYCTKKFSKSLKLKDHVRTHTGERPYQCEYCGSAFATVHTLKVHKRIHTGVRPYECNVCGHAFTQLANLQSHLRTHSNERPFLCPQCGFAFKEKAHLDGHMFLHTGEKPFQCSMCEKRFPNKSALNTHKKNHLGVRPFQCQFCEKRFPRPYQLAEHLRSHTGSKIICEICNHGFTHMSSFKTHMRVHEDGPKYECSKCGKKFSRKRNLKRHAEMKVKPCS